MQAVGIQKIVRVPNILANELNDELNQYISKAKK